MHHSNYLLWSFYTGLQENGINLICQTLHQMYRRTIGNIPHHTRETHTAVLEHYSVEPPLVTLDKLVNQAILSLTKALTVYLWMM